MRHVPALFLSGDMVLICGPCSCAFDVSSSCVSKMPRFNLGDILVVFNPSDEVVHKKDLLLDDFKKAIGDLIKTSFLHLCFFVLIKAYRVYDFSFHKTILDPVSTAKGCFTAVFHKLVVLIAENAKAQSISVYAQYTIYGKRTIPWNVEFIVASIILGNF